MAMDPPARDPALPEIAAQLVGARWFISLTTVAFILVFGANAFLTRPVFRAVTWIMPADNHALGAGAANLEGIGGLASMVGIDLNSMNGTKTHEAIAILRSTDFRQAFIRDLDLMPRLFADRWDAKSRRWKTGFRDPPDIGDAVRLLDRIVIVGRDEKTGLYSVQVDWTNAAEAARWANTLVDRVNHEMRDRAIARSTAMVAYLEKELETTQAVATRQALSRVLASQINERMLASVNEEYAFKRVETAAVPDRKFKPRIGLQLMVAAIAGALAGIVLVLARQAFRKMPAARAGLQ